MAEKAFSDLKVIEIGNYILAPFCAKVLADGGAEVIKIEEPGTGDESRRFGPFPDDKPHPEKSGLFLYLNANKKSITLDVRKAQGKEILKKLLKDTDVLVVDISPRELAGLKLDYHSLQGEFPELIMTSVTPFGLTGPYSDFKGYNLAISAAGYIMPFAGLLNREPLDHPMSFSEYFGGMCAATATGIALLARDKTGRGQLCDVAGFQALFGYAGPRRVASDIYYYQTLGTCPRERFGDHLFAAGTPGRTWPNAIFEVKDGDIWMYSIYGKHVVKLLELLGNPSWSREPRFRQEDPQMLNYHFETMHEEIDRLIEPELKKHTKQEMYDGFLERGIPFVPVMTIADLINSPQSQGREDYIEIDHPVVGRLPYPAHPAILSETPWKVDKSAPLLGQHNEEIYCGKLNYSKADLLEMERAGII